MCGDGSNMPRGSSGSGNLWFGPETTFSTCYEVGLRANGKKMCGTAEDGRQFGARVEAEKLAEQHVAGVEQAHRLLVLDTEAVRLEVFPPPAGTEQPELGERGAALSMAMCPQQVRT